MKKRKGKRYEISMTDIYTTDKKYSIIYADPPWQYQHRGCEGAADKHYETISMDELGKLPIPRIADENCVLFLWMTFPKCGKKLDGHIYDG